jgi:hypothetical protein
MIRSAIILTALLSVAALPAAAASSGAVADTHTTAVASKAAKAQIAVGDLPRPVADAVRTHYPNARVSKAFRVGRGSDMRYEVHVKMAKGVKATKLTLGADGTIVTAKQKKS